MIKKLLNWLLSFFSQEKEARQVIKRIDKLDDKLKEIENEKNSTDDIVDYFNK